MEYFVVIVFGLCLGSFLSVFVGRLDRKEGIVAGRSECPQCGHILAWYDLMPLVSFFLLGGKCRYCKTAIPVWYPGVEIGTAALAVMFFYRYGWFTSERGLFLLFGMLGFWTLFLFDLKYMLLPDKVVFPMILAGLVFHLLSAGMWINPLLTGLLAFLLFDIIYVVWAGHGMGFGDVKLAALVGIFFGYPLAVPVIIAAVWLAALSGIGLMLLGRATLKTALPFGSFLSIVAVLTIIFIDDILRFTSIFI